MFREGSQSQQDETRTYFKSWMTEEAAEDVFLSLTTRRCEDLKGRELTCVEDLVLSLHRGQFEN